MCAGIEDYGRCVPVEEAYEQAVNGNKRRPSVSDQDVDDGNYRPGEQVKHQTDELGEYQKSYFARLKLLIEEPEAALIKKPKVIRGLVMPYGKKTLYTPRHIYIIVEDPSFILGDYMARPKKDFSNSLINPIR